MSDHVPIPGDGSAAVEAYEAAAERLLDVLLAVCRSDVGFPEQVRDLLAAVVQLFAVEPELAYVLTVWPFCGDEEIAIRYQHWQQRYADLLRDAAARSPATYRHPPFFECTLVAGIHWRISRDLLAGGPVCLEQLLSELTDFVLVCYLDPEQRAAVFVPAPRD